MAEQKQGTNRGGNEPSNRELHTSDALRRKIPGVNFEELNFEQRRAPYNSGERQYDAPHHTERTDRTSDDR